MSVTSQNQSSQYLGNPGDCPGAARSSPSNPFEKQALVITHRLEYKSPEELVKTLEGTVDFERAEQSFLYVHGIRECDCEEIQRQLKAVALRFAVRFTFEDSLNAAILRIMAGPERGMVSSELLTEIRRKIASIPGHSRHSIFSVGATLFRVPGVRSKEGDQGLRPDTRLGREAWASLIIEVGCPEIQNLLKFDAEWWLLNSEGRTRFVIIAKIGRNPFSLRIEGWKMCPPTTGNGRDLWIPKCIQDFDIDSTGVVSSPLGSTELRIPYNCLFDRSSPTPQPIIFTFPELSSFARGMFEVLQ